MCDLIFKCKLSITDFGILPNRECDFTKQVPGTKSLLIIK